MQKNDNNYSVVKKFLIPVVSSILCFSILSSCGTSNSSSPKDKIISIKNPNIDTKVDLSTEPVGNFSNMDEMQDDEVKYLSDFLDNWRETIIGLKEHKYTPENYKNDFLSQTNKFFNLLDDKYKDSLNTQMTIIDFRMVDCIDEAYRLTALNTEKQIDFESGDTHLQFVYDSTYDQFVFDLSEICNNLGNAYFPDSYNIEENKKIKEEYEDALKSFKEGDFETAYNRFDKIDKYSDSNKYIRYIDAVKWYNDDFQQTLNQIANEAIIHENITKKEFESIEKNLSNLNYFESPTGENYYDNILSDIYDSCIESQKNKHYTNYYRRLNLLIENNYKTDECNQQLKDFENMFKNIAGTYEDEEDYSFTIHECVVKINIDSMKISIQPNLIFDKTPSPEDTYVFDLNPSGKYSYYSIKFLIKNNKISEWLDDQLYYTYRLKRHDAELLSEIDDE